MTHFLGVGNARSPRAYAVPVTSVDVAAGPTAESGPEPRTQSLMLTFFGAHVLGRPIAVSSGSVIAALGRLGSTEEAVRTTLNRMVKRGLLERRRQGRKTYFGLTPHAVQVLTDGRDRIWRTGAVNRDWDGRWTMVGFSLPEAWSRERHDLRSRLIWAGFGPLQNGLWVAPARVDVREMVAGLGLEPYLRVFRAEVETPTDVREVLEQAFDVAGHRCTVPGVPGALGPHRPASRSGLRRRTRRPAPAAHRLAGPGATGPASARRAPSGGLARRSGGDGLPRPGQPLGTPSRARGRPTARHPDTGLIRARPPPLRPSALESRASTRGPV